MSIFQLLIQFVFRATFGVALAMGITPARWVSSGFYRVHLWVLMGFNTLASLTLYTQRDTFSSSLLHVNVVLALAIALAVVSYVGAVLWLYEKVTAGYICLFLIALAALAAASLATPWRDRPAAAMLTFLDVITSGLLLGTTLSAMFLGHWYLNSPTMELLPLRRLVWILAAWIAARMLVSGTGLLLQVQADAALGSAFWIFVALRWLSGLIGTLSLAVMTWYTLKIPNTQSATGILYAGVILAFIGELTSQFLSLEARYPL